MHKKGAYFLLFWSPVIALSLETTPWMGASSEFYSSSAYTYSRFDRVQDASVQLSSPSNDHLFRFDLGFAFSEIWDLEVELEVVDTPRQSWGYRSLAVQGRIQWLDDIGAGDPVSCTTAFNIRNASSRSLHDVSCPYHYVFDFELNTAVGKEWSRGPNWVMRTWGNVGIGIANRGAPWLRALGVFEKNWANAHRAFVFTEGYFGFGSQQSVDVDHFHGWARYLHQSIDLGVGYQYHFAIWGDLSFSYAHRIYARTFPEHVNFFTLVYRLPFSTS